MIPNVKKETQTGWLILAGTTLVVIVGLWLVSDGGSLEELAQQQQSSLAVSGHEDMAIHVERQIEANEDLRTTIEHLKQQTSLILADEFTVKEGMAQAGNYFRSQFYKVHDRLYDKAKARKITYDEYLGFGKDPAIPPDDQAQYLLIMLQLTEKIVGIAFDSERPLESLSVSHGPTVDTGPETRPALVREYPLKLEVRGGLKDILGILHRISVVTKSDDGDKRRDYPLILRGFSIKSENATPKDDISQLEAVFDLAAMHFIPEDERAKDPLAFQSVGSGSRSSSGGGKAVFHARP